MTNRQIDGFGSVAWHGHVMVVDVIVSSHDVKCCHHDFIIC